MTITINGTTGIAGVDGSAGTPAVQGNDTNTGIFFPAADTIGFAEGGAEAMRIDSSGNVGIGTSSPANKLDVNGQITASSGFNSGDALLGNGTLISGGATSDCGIRGGRNILFAPSSTAERARITSGGNLLVAKTVIDVGVAGAELRADGLGGFTRSGDAPLEVNRLTNDGSLVNLRQDSTIEGTISVSGTTVSYNGGHLSRWAQMLTKPDLLKGTVMSNLDEMNVYTDAEGNPIENEQLNKVKVSDVEGDVNVAGVFVNWTYDEAHQVDEINMAMTGDMIIRIAQGVVVQKGDLLMSAGDGTAKPQGDDIVRSKTVAKVTSNHVTCTYEDGSYCVPCVLMAC
jgi:hypothetical protein